MNTSAGKQGHWVWIAAAAAVVATTVWQGRSAKAGADAGICKQWQTATMPPAILLNAPLPEMGKPYIDNAPEGWEPFALGHGGQLIYKRCVK